MFPTSLLVRRRSAPTASLLHSVQLGSNHDELQEHMTWLLQLSSTSYPQLQTFFPLIGFFSVLSRAVYILKPWAPPKTPANLLFKRSPTLFTRYSGSLVAIRAFFPLYPFTHHVVFRRGPLFNSCRFQFKFIDILSVNSSPELYSMVFFSPFTLPPAPRFVVEFRRFLHPTFINGPCFSYT